MMKTPINRLSDRMAALMILCAMLCVSVASCGFNGNKDNPGGEAIPYSNLVTFESANAKGQTFSYQTGPDTPPIYLESTKRIDTTIVKIGTRVVLYYDLPEGAVYGQSGPINLKRYGTVLNTVLKQGTIPSIWNSNQLRAITANRTGHWLNLTLSVTNPQFPSQFDVMVSSQDLNRDQCEVFLITNIREDMDRPLGYLSSVIASVNIEWLMTRYPNIHTMNLHLPYDNETIVEIPLR